MFAELRNGRTETINPLDLREKPRRLVNSNV